MTQKNDTISGYLWSHDAQRGRYKVRSADPSPCHMCFRGLRKLSLFSDAEKMTLFTEGKGLAITAMAAACFFITLTSWFRQGGVSWFPEVLLQFRNITAATSLDATWFNLSTNCMHATLHKKGNKNWNIELEKVFKSQNICMFCYTLHSHLSKLSSIYIAIKTSGMTLDNLSWISWGQGGTLKVAAPGSTKGLRWVFRNHQLCLEMGWGQVHACQISSTLFPLHNYIGECSNYDVLCSRSILPTQ